MRVLSAQSSSLAYEPAAARPGTIFVLGPDGGVSADPVPGATVTFGRNLPDVDVCVGADDDRVSRRHGLLTCEGRRWTIRNTGRLPIRLPASQMVYPDSEPVQLPDGYTRCSSGADRAANTPSRSGSPEPPVWPDGATTRRPTPRPRGR